MHAYDLMTTDRGDSGHPDPGALEPSDAARRLTIETCVLFGTLLGPAVVVSDPDSDADRAHIDSDTDLGWRCHKR